MANLTGPLSYCDKCHREVGGLFIKANGEFWCNGCVERWIKEIEKESKIKDEIITRIMKKYETL